MRDECNLPLVTDANSIYFLVARKSFLVQIQEKSHDNICNRKKHSMTKPFLICESIRNNTTKMQSAVNLMEKYHFKHSGGGGGVT